MGLDTTSASAVKQQNADIVYKTSTPLCDFQPLFAYMDLCSRLPPPPIPPWLRETPNRLRHLVSNCSSWNKYADLCSLQVPLEYSQALFNSEAAFTQWVPSIIALLMAAAIVISAGVVYYLYQSKRLKLDFLDGGHSQTSVDHEYISKLSVCALEDNCFTAISLPQLIVDDLGHRSDKAVISSVSVFKLCTSPWHTPGEIILLPERLVDDDMQFPSYVTDLSGCDYHSSHSLPIDSDCEKLIISTKQPYQTVVSGGNKYESSFFKRFQKEKPLQKYYQCLGRQFRNYNHHHNSSYRKMAGAKGMIHGCGKAGTSLIRNAAFWNRSSSHVLTQQPKAAPAFIRLGQSVYNMCRSRHRFHQTSTRLHTSLYDSTHITVSSSFSSSCIESTTPTTSSSSDMSSCLSQPTANRIRFRGQFLHYMRNRQAARNQEKRCYQSEQVHMPPFTCANEAYESHHGSGIKLQRFTFRAEHMTHIL